MAKWGEGDPRWIVEERPDATNVNNWHWTEKNAGDWSRNKLKDLLIGLSIPIDSSDLAGTCRITELSKAEGDASTNNRKAKLIIFFEWSLELKFEVDLETSDEKLTGTLEIPNLSDENSADEVDVNVKMDSSSDEAYKVKEIVRKKMEDCVKKALGEYITQLKEEYGKTIILPTKDGQPGRIQATTTTNHTAIKNSDVVKQKPEPTSRQPNGVKIETRTLQLSDAFVCSPMDLYQIFTMPESVAAFMRNPVEMDCNVGGKFRFFNGHVDGSFLALEPGQKLSFLWRTKNWPAGHYSTVTLNFRSQDNGTVLKLEQSQVPSDHWDSTEDGWRRHYFEAIKQTFGIGARLF